MHLLLTGIDWEFLSTPSARRATNMFRGKRERLQISIHALREEGDTGTGGEVFTNIISIHALREEGDRRTHAPVCLPRQFLSTPSARRATRTSPTAATKPSISIHALREEGDLQGCYIICYTEISIHALREEGDREIGLELTRAKAFLSTPSARRATEPARHFFRRLIISIHALREEGDARFDHFTT